MGGKALKNTYTRRYQKGEYFSLWYEVRDLLRAEGIKCKILLSYRQKDSFGDMDVIVLKDSVLGNISDVITRVFKPNEIFKNGPVLSFDYKELQIDFIMTSSRNWETSYNFFAWNDLGNYIGKIAHKFGLKYGQDGLTYVYRTENEDRVLGTITVSTDQHAILTFLGLDFETWRNGFETKEDIFEYIISSKYFNPSMFKFDQLSAKHRKRNKKRQMYLEFLEYIKDLDSKRFFYNFVDDKTKHWDMIENSFPGFKERIRKFQLKEERRNVVRNKFNGDKIMKMTGRTGKSLGSLIDEFRNKYTDEWIYNNPESVVDEKILEINQNL